MDITSFGNILGIGLPVSQGLQRHIEWILIPVAVQIIISIVVEKKYREHKYVQTLVTLAGAVAVTGYTGLFLLNPAAKSAGDAGRGELAYKTYCESCHGAEGRGGQKGSAITDGAFLALVSDQGLRTVVINGRPELNAPDWRGNVPGKPMAEQEVTDVVAWLASKRVRNPGQPYPAAQNTPAPGAR